MSRESSIRPGGWYDTYTRAMDGWTFGHDPFIPAYAKVTRDQWVVQDLVALDRAIDLWLRGPHWGGYVPAGPQATEWMKLNNQDPREATTPLTAFRVGGRPKVSWALRRPDPPGEGWIPLDAQMRREVPPLPPGATIPKILSLDLTQAE